MIGKTYIEKIEYYYTNRVFIVSKIIDTYIISKVVNLDTWKINTTRMKRSYFKNKMELSPVQMYL